MAASKPTTPAPDQPEAGTPTGSRSSTDTGANKPAGKSGGSSAAGKKSGDNPFETTPSVYNPNTAAEQVLPPVSAEAPGTALSGAQLRAKERREERQEQARKEYEEGPPRAAADLFPSAVAPVGKVSYDLADSRLKMIDALVDEYEGIRQRVNAERGDRREQFQDRLSSVEASLSNFGTSYEEAAQARKDRAERVARGENPDPNAPSPHQGMIDALLDERQGYVDKGLDDRVAAVDESLARLGTTYEEAARNRGDKQQDRSSQPRTTDRASQQQTR